MSQGSSNSLYGAKLPPDTAKEVDAVQERYNLNKSEAVRRLIQRGLSADSKAEQFSQDFRHVAQNLWMIAGVTFVIGLFVVGYNLLTVLGATLVFFVLGACAALISDYYEPEGV